MATIEQIKAKLVQLGRDKGFDVVPEFCAPLAQKRPNKLIDIAWLSKRAVPNNALLGSLRDWEVRAAFEIEGAGCSINRLDEHCSQFQLLAGNWGVNLPPFCSVVLYDVARHRTDAEWHVPKSKADAYLADWEERAQDATNRHPHAPVAVLGAWNEGWEHEIQIA